MGVPIAQKLYFARVASILEKKIKKVCQRACQIIWIAVNIINVAKNKNARIPR